ncbi:MAG TPA: ABC transporter ATP-binding protein [Woeseiaceae bacterium]|nr:ABC transporter ATP-binding protein [Woeseiaceae bacterium]
MDQSRLSDPPCPLIASALDVSVPGRVLVEALDLRVAPGEFVAVLGCNGSGKTMTLETLAGLRPRQAGDIRYFGRPAAEWRRPELARRLALLPQDQEDLFPSTVLEEALIGRHPHIGRWRWESEADRQIALSELERVGLAGLAGRGTTTLSGGERRRLAIAQTLSQRPELFLLDEPTNHLDPRHQLLTLEVIRERVAAGAAAVVSLHDVNLAGRYADRCLLLDGDGGWELGDTDAVLNADSLSRLYRTPMAAVDWRGGRLFVPDASAGSAGRP